MRPDEYLIRKKLRPCRIKESSRYVMGRLHSHRRPVAVPASMEPDDSPETRGLTRKNVSGRCESEE
jgi:hypothetical protein